VNEAFPGKVEHMTDAGFVHQLQLNGRLEKTDDLWLTGVALVGALCGQVRPFNNKLFIQGWLLCNDAFSSLVQSYSHVMYQ